MLHKKKILCELLYNSFPSKLRLAEGIDFDFVELLASLRRFFVYPVPKGSEEPSTQCELDAVKINLHPLGMGSIN